MKKILCPSMMCADFDNLAKEVKYLEGAGVDVFHCDVMDGAFVPNMAMGIQDIISIRNSTDKPIDVHLMIESPFTKLDWFIDIGVNIIYIHPESDHSPSKSLSYIKSKGVQPGIVLNPSTSIESILTYIHMCDYILVMSVEPGFAGQEYLKFVDEKIMKLSNLKSKYGFKIIVDGAISPEKVESLYKIGADGFVLGTSTLFNKGKPYDEILRNLRSD